MCYRRDFCGESVRRPEYGNGFEFSPCWASSRDRFGRPDFGGRGNSGGS